jgi:hypothetical protein
MKNRSKFSLFIKKKKDKKAVLEIFGITLFCIITIVSSRYVDLKGGFFSIDYRTTEGVVTKSGVEYRSGYRKGFYHYDILYQYSVDGIQLESEEIDFAATGFGTKQKAQDVADRYPVGAKVKVYYEIGNADFSVLEPKTNENSSFILLFSVLCLPFLLIVYFVFKKLKSPKESAIKASLKRRK